MPWIDNTVPEVVDRDAISDAAGMFGLVLARCDCKLPYCKGYRFYREDQVITDGGYNITEIKRSGR